MRQGAHASSLPVTWRERLLLAGVFVLPLVCWPGLDRPFSTPKLWLLAGLAVVQTAAQLRSRAATAWFDQLAWPWVLWLAALGLSAVVAPSVSFYALLVAVLPLPLFFAVHGGHVDVERLLRTLAWASALESAIVLLQWLGADPLRALAWMPDVSGSARMRVYGTLGNPDFVAAWLCGTLPLVVIPPGGWRRLRALALLLLQLLAILATGSRVLLLALVATLAVLALARPRSRVWWVAALPVAALVVWLSPARPLGVTVQGRYYLVRVTGAHLAGVPVTGYGPGSFAGKFAGWQVQWFRQHRTGPPQFAGRVDHAHNDYLEFWVEYGPVGFFAFLILAGWLIVHAWPPAPRIRVVALAGAASLLVIALVDFPFHRPAEWALAWLLLAASVPPPARTAANRESLRKKSGAVKDIEAGVRHDENPSALILGEPDAGARHSVGLAGLVDDLPIFGRRVDRPAEDG